MELGVNLTVDLSVAVGSSHHLCSLSDTLVIRNNKTNATIKPNLGVRSLKGGLFPNLKFL